VIPKDTTPSWSNAFVLLRPDQRVVTPLPIHASAAHRTPLHLSRVVASRLKQTR
jgi:hypothetical protein